MRLAIKNRLSVTVPDYERGLQLALLHDVELNDLAVVLLLWKWKVVFWLARTDKYYYWGE